MSSSFRIHKIIIFDSKPLNLFAVSTNTRSSRFKLLYLKNLLNLLSSNSSLAYEKSPIVNIVISLGDIFSDKINSLTKEDIFALTENDFLGLVNNDNTYLLPFYKLKDFLNKPILEKAKTRVVLLKDLLIDQEFNALANFIIRSFGEEITAEQVTELKDTQMLALTGFGKGKLAKFNEFKQWMQKENHQLKK